MLTWGNLGLNKKIMVIISVFLLIIIGMAATTLARIDSLSAEAGQMRQAEQLRGVMLAREIDHLNWVFTVQTFVFDANKTELSIQEDPSKCGLGQWYYGQGRADAEAGFPGVASALKQMEAFHTALHASAGGIKALRAQGDMEGAKAYFTEHTLPALTGVQKLMREVVGEMTEQSGQSAADFLDNVTASQVTTIVIVCVALVLALVLGFIIARSITAPTIVLARYARKVAEGEFQAELAMKPRKDELGHLSSALSAMVNNMVGALRQAEEKAKEAEKALADAEAAQKEAEAARIAAVKAKSEGMRTAADRLGDVVAVVSSASEQLSVQVSQSEDGAATQAQRLSETAAAMEQMNSTVLEVASSAASASEVSAQARQKAQDGAHVVRQAVSEINGVYEVSLALKEDMAQLAEHAESITNIMRVITDIADQTNLLALNAAIEAARAGDAGRGFAVVADEVRKLAEKTVTSTTDVGEAIASIQKSVELSIGQADKAVSLIGQATRQAEISGSALVEIVDLVDQSADRVQAIAAASEQQSAASEQINRSVSEINSISEQTAQAMQQAAEAVGELARQSSSMQNLIQEMRAA